MKVIEGHLGAHGRTFALIVSRFNSFITERLLDGALDALKRSGAGEDDITVIRTPGAFEIPAVAPLAADSGKFDAVVCLGAVIRGETPHFDYVSAEVAKGVASVAAQSNVPVTFGVLTTDSIEQAIDRAGTKAGNKGYEAAMAAMELADLYGNLASK